MTYTRPGLIRSREINWMLLKEVLRRRHGGTAVAILLMGLLSGCATAQKPVAETPPMPKVSKRVLARAALAPAAVPIPAPEFIDIPVQVQSGTVALSSSEDLTTWSAPVMLSFARPLTLTIRDYDIHQTSHRFYRSVGSR